jgi:1-acyl-sn-glycerol-3-phosphate acyltransferase
VAALIFQGVATVVCIFPFSTDSHRMRLKRRWSKAMLDILGVRLDTDLRHAVPGSMLVANHISWLDIFVINAALPTAFVSKEEVRHWPVIGWLAAVNDTVFLKRGSRGHAKIINQEIADVLATGKHVGVFPEGTTTDGTHVLHFHAALLQPALAAGRPVVPAAISYWEPDGSRSLAPRYDGDISIGQCLSAILARPKLIARLVTTTPLGQNGEDRRSVAAAARAAISTAAELPPPSNPPGTPVGLPAARPTDGRPTDSLNPESEDLAKA